MKKYLLSLVVALALLSTVVYGDTISLIGKKVQSQTDIVLDGVKIDEVIIIDGKSYAPVRTVSEAAGLQVDFKEGKVILTSENNGVVVVNQPTATETKPLTKQQLIYKLDSLETEKSYIQNKLNSLSDGLVGLNKIVAQYQELIDKGLDVKSNTELVEYYEKGISDNLAEQSKLEAELTTLNATIADVKDKISKL